jgi:hypothetical protein
VVFPDLIPSGFFDSYGFMDADKEKVIEVVCSCCGAVLWVDVSTGNVVKSEKAAKKKESLEDLLLREKKKQEGFATKLEATAELERKKLAKAKEKFDRAFIKAEKE